MNEICPNCGKFTNSSSSRMIEDSCGHIKCRMCLLYEEQGCKSCELGQKQSSTGTEIIQIYLEEPENFPSTTPNTCTTITNNINTETNEDFIPCELDDSSKAEKEKEKTNSKKQTNRSHIITLPGMPERYKCTVCEKIFRNKKGKCYHDVCITGIQPYHCSICDRNFVKKSHFEYHERVHSGYKPFKCELCEAAFPQKNKLNRHMLSHSKEKPFTCTTCCKRYCKNDDLKLHMMVHTGLMPHLCKICGKAFRIRSNLNRHMHSHSSERPYVCDICGKSFKEKSLLVRHSKTHSKDRPYSCDHCPRVFLSKGELRRHLTIHSDTKPFCCTICKTDFRRKDNLNRHIRHHHSENSSMKIRVLKKDDKKIKKPKLKSAVKPAKTPKVKSKKKTQNNATKKPAEAQNNSRKDLRVGVSTKIQLNSRIDTMENIIPVMRVPGESSNAVPVINGPISILRPDERSEIRKKPLIFTEPISRDEALNINQRIEEKLYPHNIPPNPCFFPQLSSTIETHLPITFMSPLRHNPIKPVSINRLITERRTSDSNLTLLKNSTIIETKNSNILSNQIVDLNNEVQTSDVRTKNNDTNSHLIIEETNRVSTIKKNITINENTLIVDNDKGCEVHWRRRTAEILKPHLS